MIKNKFLAVGVMSGTSMDGIDISLILSDGKKSYKHIKSKFYSYKKSTKTILSKLVDSFSVSKHSLALISSTEELVTFEFITALKNFLKDQSLSKIDLIALHGQTVFHDPINKSSIQLCDELKIKSSFKLPIVSDFRQKDLSLGGQGAPLTPIFHQLLTQKLKITPPVCFVNIGGISNITVIDDQKYIYAYDTGPGMCLLDQYMVLKKNINFDKGGKHSLKGKVNAKILKKLMSDKYFLKKKNKSLDRNYFSLNPFMKLNFNDACATISAFTAHTIIKEADRFNAKYLIVSGGGSKNKYVIKLMQETFRGKLSTADHLNLNSDFIESQAFAYLGIRRIKDLPISFPSTTGVKYPVTGGKVN
jgi:anhydro-N-acetylmuramic acid kinase